MHWWVASINNKSPQADNIKPRQKKTRKNRMQISWDVSMYQSIPWLMTRTGPRFAKTVLCLMIILYQENGLCIETGPRGPSDIYAVLSWKEFHDIEKTVSLLFYLYNSISYTRKDGRYLDKGSSKIMKDKHYFITCFNDNVPILLSETCSSKSLNLKNIIALV